MSFAATLRREPSAVLDLIEVLVEVGDCALVAALPLALEGVALAAVLTNVTSLQAAELSSTKIGSHAKTPGLGVRGHEPGECVPQRPLGSRVGTVPQPTSASATTSRSTGSHAPGPISSRNSFPPPSRTGSQNFATPLASGGVGNVLLLGCSLSRESDDRLEAKINRLLSEHGIDPAQFDYREEAGGPG